MLTLLRGEVVFDEGTPSFNGATLFVSLHDTSYADAPAETVTSLVQADVSYDAHARNHLPFVLRGQIHDETATYTVSVHLDLDGDGKVSRGDYINVQSYPVLTRGHPDFVTIRVKQVP